MLFGLRGDHVNEWIVLEARNAMPGIEGQHFKAIAEKAMIDAVPEARGWLGPGWDGLRKDGTPEEIYRRVVAALLAIDEPGTTRMRDSVIPEIADNCIDMTVIQFGERAGDYVRSEMRRIFEDAVHERAGK